ncbi:MAG: hypothetical protein ABW174_12240 [Flavitalea sp.]
MIKALVILSMAAIGSCAIPDFKEADKASMKAYSLRNKADSLYEQSQVDLKNSDSLFKEAMSMYNIAQKLDSLALHIRKNTKRTIYD